jgi:hypothetical protein
VGNAVILQDDWSGGIYRGRRAPPNMAYDIINGLINDEGHVFRRPGTAYYTTADAPVTPIAAYAGYMTGPRARRVLAWNDTTTVAVKDDLTVMTVADVVAPHNRRPAFIAGGFLVFPGVDPGGGVKITIYGGALTNTPYSAGTAQIDFDSTRVRGTGTAWLANVQPGMILTSSVTAGTGAVGRVVSDTELTLTTPWKGSTTNVGYALTNQQTVVYGSWLPLLGTTRVGAAGTVATLIIATGNRAYFASQTFQLSELLYHELPEGVEILAVEGIGDSALLFTTGGVWRIDNLSLDVIDDQGNIQQQVTRVAPKIALWGECGISGWATRSPSAATRRTRRSGTSTAPTPALTATNRGSRPSGAATTSCRSSRPACGSTRSSAASIATPRGHDGGVTRPAPRSLRSRRPRRPPRSSSA